MSQKLVLIWLGEMDKALAQQDLQSIQKTE